MSICDLWVQYPRFTLLDFSYPVFQTCVTFLVPKPKILPYKWSSFLGGLSSEIWFLLGLTFAILWILLSATSYFIWSKNNTNFNQAFFDLFRILTTADSIPIYYSRGHMTLLGIWSIFCNFMILFFSSNIILSSTLPKYTARIDTIDDFAESNLSWGISTNVDFTFIIDLKNPAHKLMKKNFIITENKTRVVNELIAQNKFAIFTTSYFDGTATTEAGITADIKFKTSQLRIMRNCIYQPYIAFGFPYNSPFKHSIENILLRMFETGIILYNRRNELRKKNPHDWDIVFEVGMPHSDLEPKILEVIHIFGSFIILAMGHGLATIVFLWEIRKKIDEYLSPSMRLS